MRNGLQGTEGHAGLSDTRQVLTNSIQEILDQSSLSIRKATLSDIPLIDELASSRYPQDIVQEMSHFASYRFVKYGNVFVVEDLTLDKIVGCIYEQQLQGSVSFATRLIVDKEYEGLGIPKVLTQQSYIAAIDAGSKVRKGIIARDNLPSHIIHLNKLGWKYTGLVMSDLVGVKDHFEVELSLDSQSLEGEGLNDEDLMSRLLNKDPKDILLDIDDTDSIRSFFESYPNGRIQAIIRPGLVGNKNGFFLGRSHINETHTHDEAIASDRGIDLEDDNHGEPTSINILKNTPNTPNSIPQAFLIDGIWRYNLAGMKEESKYSGKKLPSDAQWLAFLAGLDSTNASEKNTYLMGQKFTDSISLGDKFLNLSNWWTKDGNVLFLREDLLHPGIYTSTTGIFPIRFLAQEKEITSNA